MEQKHLLWRKDATLIAKLVVIISLTGSGYQRPHSSCLCKVGRRKGRNTEDAHCREEWEQDRRKRRLRDWMSRENNGQQRRWKNGGSAATFPASLFVSTYLFPQPPTPSYTSQTPASSHKHLHNHTQQWSDLWPFPTPEHEPLWVSLFTV